jgi:hypothetical protein
MSKKNISTHYKKGCSGIFNQYKLTQQKKEISSKESKVRQPKQPKEPKQNNEIKTRKPRLKSYLSKKVMILWFGYLNRNYLFIMNLILTKNTMKIIL